MRTEKELLQILLDNMDYFRSGLCGMIGRLQYHGLITKEEKHMIEEYLDKKLDLSPLLFAFPRGEKEPRIKWLKEQIDKLP